MYYLIEDDELSKEYNDIWNKVINSVKQDLIANPMYNTKKLLKIKIKSYGDEATYFHDKEMHKKALVKVVWWEY